MNVRKVVRTTLYKLSANPINKFLYKAEISKRSSLPLTGIYPLSQPINMFSPFTFEIHTLNDWYGHASTLKKFLKLPQSYQFKFLIEHGCYLSEQVEELDIETNLPSMVTYSDYRVKVLKKYKTNVFSIGPFIHYANNYLSAKEIAAEKKRLGKTLLLFPSHASSLIDFSYNAKDLCEKVKKLAKGFGSVRVCMYWKDVLAGKDQIYKDYGFECVTAGHMLDPMFLPRLKSILETADLTVSNFLSTHVSYAVYMNKPHIIYLQKLKLKTSAYWEKRLAEYWDSTPYKLMLEEFSKENFKLTARQKSLARKYFGLNKIKSKKELKKIVDFTEKFYKLPRVENPRFF